MPTSHQFSKWPLGPECKKCRASLTCSHCGDGLDMRAFFKKRAKELQKDNRDLLQTLAELKGKLAKIAELSKH